MVNKGRAASNRNGGRLHSGMVGDINSESWAVSFRNVGRLQIGMVGEIARNLHQRGDRIDDG
jgi:hypothetical protein